MESAVPIAHRRVDAPPSLRNAPGALTGPAAARRGSLFCGAVRVRPRVLVRAAAVLPLNVSR